MTTFLYKGYKDDGEAVFGASAQPTRAEMETYLTTLNVFNAEIFESKTPFSKKQFSLVSASELSIFCKQISVMFFSYITVLDGIILLGEQADNKVLKTTFLEIHKLLEEGYTFAESVAMYDHVFGTYLVQMALIGERSGSLDVVFADLSNYFEKEAEIKRRVKSAIIYPACLSALTLVTFIFIVESILPLFNEILNSVGAKMSPLTANIINFSNFLDNYFILIVFFVLVAIGGVYIYLSSDNGKNNLDKIKAKTPYLSYITNRVITARFARSLGMMLKSGLDIYYALDQSTVLINNSYLLERFNEANQKIKQGEALAKSLEEINVFPSLFIKMITIGEKTGNLDEMLAKTSDMYEIEAYDAIDRTTKLIEPILITILSIVMGGLLLAIMLPMITIMNAI